MNFRTSYLVGLIASVFAVSCATYVIKPAFAADAPRVKPLKIMGPDGTIRQVNQQYGPTTSRDTFWSIAQKVRPDTSVSVYQVMAALYDANPHAFTSDNYNSLERGMILLIPSKEVMQAIPNRLAIARAERDDRQARAATTKPIKNNAVKTAPVNVEPVASQQVTSQPTPVVETPKPQVQNATPAQPVQFQSALTDTAQPKMVSSDLAARLDAADSKNLSLTDELARTQDQLTMRNTDVETLKAKVEELNQKIATLEETLLLSKQQNQALKADVEAMQTPVTAVEESAKPDDFWRNIMDNPLLLVAITVIPALLLLLLIFAWLRRKRNKDSQKMQLQQAAMAAGTVAAVTSTAAMASQDEVDDMAVHLDNDDNSIDSLLNMDSVDLQPEQEISAFEEDADVFVDSSRTTVANESAPFEDEGQSLDDLWAEAMGDQEQAFAADTEENSAANNFEEEDLDALLAGLDAEEAGTDESQPDSEPDDRLTESSSDDVVAKSQANNANNADVNDPDDLDALLAQFSVPEESASSADDIPDVELVDEANIDAGDATGSFDSREDEQSSNEDLSAAIAAELEDDVAIDDVDDIDALLAEFDKDQSPVSQADSDSLDSDSVDSNNLDTTETLVEQTSEITPSSAIAALSESQLEVEENDADLTDAIAAELDSELNIDTDNDIDALLAEFDLPAQDGTVEEHDTENALAEEPAADAAKSDDETQDNMDETANISDEIAAELNGEFDVDADIDDIDALLASFDAPSAVEPVDASEQPEVDDADNQTVNASTDTSIDNSVDTVSEQDDKLDLNAKIPLTADTASEAANDLAAQELTVDDLDSTDLDSTDLVTTDSIDSELTDANIPAEPALPELNIDDSEDVLSNTGFANDDDADLAALLAEFDVPEQSEADAQDINFDVETGADEDDVISLSSVTSVENDVALQDSTAEPDDELDEFDALSHFEPLDEDAEDFDALTAGIALAAASAAAAGAGVKDKQASYFNDLKANKTPDPHVLDWDSELGFTADKATETDSETTLETEFAKSDAGISNAQPSSAGFSVDNKAPLEFTLSTDDDEQDTLAASFDAGNAEDVLTPVSAMTKAPESLDSIDSAPELADDPQARANDIQSSNAITNDEFASLLTSGLTQDVDVNDTDTALDFSHSFDLNDDLDLSDDSVLAAFSANTEVGDDDVLTPEDSFSLDDESNLTVEEALAALDAQESRSSAKKAYVSDHDLTSFQNENGFIDIDKLLNEANEDNSDTDLYSEVGVEMSDVGALIGDAAMIDVDDEENSVNAKLDLARAYIEIDDSDSAKALLKEVQIDGNERQQAEAQHLLKDIG